MRSLRKPIRKIFKFGLCFWSSFSRRGINFEAVSLMLQLSVQTLAHVPYATCGMLLNIINCKPSILVHDFKHFFHIFINPTWRWATCAFKTFNQTLATFETWIPFRGFCSSHNVDKKRFLKRFIGSRGSFVKVKTQFEENSMLLKACHCTGQQ